MSGEAVFVSLSVEHGEKKGRSIGHLDLALRRGSSFQSPWFPRRLGPGFRRFQAALHAFWSAGPVRLAACLAVGGLLALAPAPAGLSASAWRLVAICIATVLAWASEPLPRGAVGLLAMGALMVVGNLSFGDAFSGFTTEAPWLFAIADWASGSLASSGLCARLAYSLVARFGGTPLGLAYSLVATEALLALAVPSPAARAALVLPLLASLCQACGGELSAVKGTERLGGYLVASCFLASAVSSGMFLTGLAANSLAATLAEATLHMSLSWGTWARAALAPGLASLLLTPPLLLKLWPPEVEDTAGAAAKARRELASMGPPSIAERLTAAALAATVVMWALGGRLGLPLVAAALVGLALLLVAGVLSWEQCLANSDALDGAVWLGAAASMALQLHRCGFAAWLGDKVEFWIRGAGLGWQASLWLVAACYASARYLTGSAAMHIGFLHAACLSGAAAAGIAPLRAALLLAQLVGVTRCLTASSAGAPCAYFSAGYVSRGDWLAISFVVSAAYCAIWGLYMAALVGGG
eukprot:scaffold2.g7390.t1